MNPDEQEMMEQMEGMKNMMEMMQQMQQAQTGSENAGESSASFDFLKGMMDPEQQNMFDMYNNIFSSALNSADSDIEKGEKDYE